jgi:hypothetical protein
MSLILPRRQVLAAGAGIGAGLILPAQHQRYPVREPSSPDMGPRVTCHPQYNHHAHVPKNPIALSEPRTRAGRVIWGASSRQFPEFRTAIPLAGYARAYWHGTNVIGSRWPVLPGARVILSFEPYPPDLLAGRLDARILRLASTAPPGSVLIPWYEAGPNNCRGYPRFVTASSVRDCQGYLHRLLQHTGVRVGSCICGPADQLEAWMAKGLPVYTVDIDGDWFMRSDGSFQVARFNTRACSNLEVFRRLSGRTWPQIMVPETNSDKTEWFWLIADWYARHGGAVICTFWRANRPCQGSAAKPWPPRPGVLPEIRYLSELFGGQGIGLW